MKVPAIFDRSISLLAFLAGILYALLMLSICAEITRRYLLDRSIVWLPEVLEYSLLYITFLAAAWVLKQEGHVKMDVVLKQLSLRNQSIVNVITSTLGAIVCLVITWYGVRVTWDYWQIGYITPQITKILQWPILAIIPVGSFLLSIQFLRRTYDFLHNWRTSQD